MPASTPRLALPYPLATEPVAQGDDAIKALAERIEAAFPATAAGEIAVGAPTSSPVRINFPAGRFPTSGPVPIVNVTVVSGGSNNVDLIPNTVVGNTYFDVYLYGNGGAWTSGAIAIHWAATARH